MDMTNKRLHQIGIQIKTLRMQKDMTVGELAERADISEKYLYEIESGKKNFSVRILLQLSTALEAMPNDILVKKHK